MNLTSRCKELARNQHLAERLLETEESVRRDVARELHDDIGQTITAIRTQAALFSGWRQITPA